MTTSAARPSPAPSGEPAGGSDAESFRRLLLDDGIIRDAHAKLTPLTGGVSSDIYRVDDGNRTFVVKRALAKLRVRDDWQADTSRNRSELEYLRLVGSFLPDAVPRVLEARPDHGYFAMEYLGGDLATWKGQLLRGECDPASALRAGRVLGAIHRHTWGDATVRAQFETTANFHQLRTAPYLLTVAERHPAIAPLVRGEAARLEGRRLALVHGDYSPKNLLVGPDRLVVLDCEVAWFGDPSFDVAFLLNHLLLKSLHLPAARRSMLDLAAAAGQAYSDAVGPDHAREVEAPLPTLLPMLMLARVDGKSPAEYLTEPERQAIRRFVLDDLAQPAASLRGLLDRWSAFLKNPTP